jgi:hypothetical protein
MTNDQYNEIMRRLCEIEALVRAANPPRYVAPMRTPDDHIYQTPARLPSGPSYEPPWKVTCDAAQPARVAHDWHTSGYISADEAHG